MFSFNSLHHHSRPCAAHRTFSAHRALAALPGLLTAFLFLGCPMSGGGDGGGPYTAPASLIGTWESSYSEKAIISTTEVFWDNGYGLTYTAAIRNSPDFTRQAGVIIIEYYPPYPTYNDYEADGITPKSGGPYAAPGHFTALYWKALSTGSVDLANAWGDLSNYDHGGAPEKTTYAEAASTYTMDTVGNYAARYSTCAKQ